MAERPQLLAVPTSKCQQYNDTFETPPANHPARYILQKKIGKTEMTASVRIINSDALRITLPRPKWYQGGRASHQRSLFVYDCMSLLHW